MSAEKCSKIHRRNSTSSTFKNNENGYVFLNNVSRCEKKPRPPIKNPIIPSRPRPTHQHTLCGRCWHDLNDGGRWLILFCFVDNSSGQFFCTFFQFTTAVATHSRITVVCHLVCINAKLCYEIVSLSRLNQSNTIMNVQGERVIHLKMTIERTSDKRQEIFDVVPVPTPVEKCL